MEGEKYDVNICFSIIEIVSIDGVDKFKIKIHLEEKTTKRVLKDVGEVLCGITDKVNIVFDKATWQEHESLFPDVKIPLINPFDAFPDQLDN